ncbi:MAG: type VI secretion system contractile sheath domain-containing protein [Solidesulfovibrio sp. DCME]|uniref:type VI secretion system contractile sheath domain-containing protein n=1 Tax=Solidesulfovibrio sp. DCME TaxID=3447380 RepID=UPI003D1337C2
MVVNEADYVAQVLAPFGPAVGSGKPVSLAVPEDLDAAVAELAGVFAVSVPRQDCPEGTVSVPVARLADFKPVNIARACPWLARVGAARGYLDAAARDGQAPDVVAAGLRTAFPDLPVDFTLPAAAAAPAGPPGEAAGSAAAIDAILGMVAMPEAGARPAPGAAGPAAWKAALEGLTGRVMAAIFADSAFRAAEAAWRGLRLIVQQAGADSPLRLRLCPAVAATLPEALERLVREPEAAPPNLILADVALDAAAARLDTWAALADTADRLLTPTAVSLSPAFFHLAGFGDVSRIGYPARALDDAAYAKWRKLAAGPGGGWLAALFGRFVLRAPYGPGNPARGAAVSEPEALWGSPVWALGAAVAKSLARSGWPHRLGIADGVVLENLDVVSDTGGARAVESLLADDQLLDFAAAGLTPLAGRAGGDKAFFRQVACVDRSPFGPRLVLNRILSFFFRSRNDDACREALAASGPEALAALLTKRLALFFQATGLEAPVDLALAATARGDGAQLAIGFTPPPVLGLGPRRLEFDFAW